MAANEDDGEKTEEPTQKRLREAEEKGDLAKSQDVSIWFALAGIALALGLAAPPAAADLAHNLRFFLLHADDLNVEGGPLLALGARFARISVIALSAPVAILVLFAILGNIVQHKPVLTLERIKPKFEKISPKAGLKRLFSRDALVNFIKGIVKIVIIGVAMGLVLWAARDTLDTIILRPLSQLPGEAGSHILVITGVALAVMACVAGADFIYQKQSWLQRKKMSLREVRDELKQSEGDPHVKARIRQLRQARAGKRMMARLPEAALVITNPTHFAVALKYNETMAAPVCIAKGVDTLALRIRKVAKAHNVPVVESPPLARALHASVEIDEQIPEQHYKAVAQVIGFVLRQKTRARPPQARRSA